MFRRYSTRKRCQVVWHAIMSPYGAFEYHSNYLSNFRVPMGRFMRYLQSDLKTWKSAIRGTSIFCAIFFIDFSTNVYWISSLQKVLKSGCFAEVTTLTCHWRNPNKFWLRAQLTFAVISLDTRLFKLARNHRKQIITSLSQVIELLYGIRVRPMET